MAKTATYAKIATTTLGSATNSFTFSSIPSTYTDLILVVNGSATGTGGRFRINGDTGTNYSYRRLYGNGSVAASDGNSNQDYAYGSDISTSFCVNIYNFMDYSNTTTYKTIITRANPSNSMVACTVNLWRSTAAITSIEINTGGVNMNIGSTLTLYGIQAGNA